MTSTKIFRFKLNDDLSAIITQFAKIHLYDDRHTYKDAWQNWLVENRDSVDREVVRLQQLDYKGDVVDKMFKTGRYYFRGKEEKKNDKKKGTTLENNNKPPASRSYIVMQPELIQAMDKHLMSGIMKEDKFKPAKAYTQFCEQHETILHREIRRLFNEHPAITGEKIGEKIKKTYKNRYFILSQVD